VSVEDLGDWGGATLWSEYDAQERAIRINARAIERLREERGSLDSCTVAAVIDRAIAHEIYHHREAIGEIARIPAGSVREAAAHAYAAALTEQTAGGEPYATGLSSTGRR